MPNKPHQADAAFAHQAVLSAVLQKKAALSRPKDYGPQTLAGFCTLMDPTYEITRHTELICEYLEALERRDIRKLMLFLPPRHGKTIHMSRFFPAWWLGRQPRSQIILAGYNDEIAEGYSRHVRDQLKEAEWPYGDCQLRTDTQSVSHWETTRGGVLRAVGVGGGATGYGAHLLVIDDYCKNREEADSLTQRERAWSWYTDVMLTRLMPNAVQLVGTTRWHEDDLAGRILAAPGGKEWTVVSLPALAEAEGDALGRSPGEALWPERYPVKHLIGVRDVEGSRSWAALYQQTPITEEGNMFRRSWWQWYSPSEMADQGLAPALITVDSAFKEGVANDYSVAEVWGIRAGRVYLMDVWRKRVEFPQLLQGLHDLYSLYHVPIVIEDKGSGQSAIQVLARAIGTDGMRIPVVAYRMPRYSTKVSRAELVTPYVEGGLVFLPKGEPWTEAFVEEHAAFPSAPHDDQVDATAIALSRLFSMFTEQVSAGPRYTTYKLGPGGGPADESASGAAIRELFGESLPV